jgi:hypothetical protein
VTEHRLEPYRNANMLEFMREVFGILGGEFRARLHHDARASEDEFEVYTRWFGSDERGVRLEERNGIDPRTSHVNREHTRVVIHGFQAVTLEVETMDGVLEGSFVTLRVEASPALEAALLELFTRTFSRR